MIALRIERNKCVFYTADPEKVSTTSYAGAKEKKFCNCGRNRKTRVRSCSEIPSLHKKARKCPCVAAKRKCSNECNCIGCTNHTTVNDSSCRCGEGKRKESMFTSCHGKVGQRKTKCPCFSQGIACGSDCRCLNCQNDFGSRNVLSMRTRRAQKITSSSPSSKRKPIYEYLDQAKAAIKFGSWTTMETCILSTTESYIASICIAPTTENIQKLYNFVVKSVQMQMNVSECIQVLVNADECR